MSIQLTERAAAHVRRFLASEGKPEALLRLGVKTTGCSGYAYTVAPADAPGPEDTEYLSQGIRLLVDARSLPFLEGMEVDFTREGLNEGFRFTNPNVKATCGCGESFSV